MESLQRISKWILIVSALFAILEIIVGLSLAFAPSSFLEDVDLEAKGVSNIIQMWAIRQFALGVILAFATFRRSAPMLQLAWIFMLVMFTGDLIIGISRKEMSLVIAAIIMCVISIGILYSIRKSK
jgi:hypothetical protein